MKLAQAHPLTWTKVLKIKTETGESNKNKRKKEKVEYRECEDGMSDEQMSKWEMIRCFWMNRKMTS